MQENNIGMIKFTALKYTRYHRIYLSKVGINLTVMRYRNNESSFKLVSGRSSVHAVPLFYACTKLKHIFIFSFVRKKIPGTLQRDLKSRETAPKSQTVKSPFTGHCSPTLES